MSEQDNTGNPPSELDLLKERARMMGVSFSNNIGVDALKAKIQEKLDGKPRDEQAGPKENPLEQAQDAPEPEQAPVKVPTLREKLHAEQMALVRVRITNLDPKKKDLPGEIVTVANEYLGTVRKFIPFGEHTEDGYHVETCLLNVLRSRKFLNIRTSRDRRTGTQQVSQTWAPEFSIEVLDPLTPAELRQLAQAQIAAGSVESQAA